jgi:hypothetical protein
MKKKNKQKNCIRNSNSLLFYCIKVILQNVYILVIHAQICKQYEKNACLQGKLVSYEHRNLSSIPDHGI